MTQVTDEMIEDALFAHIRSYRKHPDFGTVGPPDEADDRTGGKHFEAMRAALEAALAAAEPPSPDKQPISCATCNGTGSLWNGGVESGRCPICGGTGQEPAEPPSPGDAEFARALDHACYDTFRAGYDYARKMNPSLRVPHLICDILPGETHTARQHILDLHRQARRAGLRAIRDAIYQESETCDRRSEFQQGYGDGVDWALDQIDAMLQGAEGEGE